MVAVNGSGMAIEARGLTHWYGRGRHRTPVLRGLDLEVPAGSYIALRGPSGAGKSTLLGLIGGLEAPRGGRLRVGDAELGSLRGRRLAAYRRAVVGFVFQHYGLIDVLTAAENVAMAMSIAHVPAAQRQRRAAALLDGVGLGDRSSHRPAQLSGGERQRVAIARALVNSPALILADEPTGNLDDESANRVLDLLDQLRMERGCTLLVVTHDSAVAARAQTVLRLCGGRIDS